MVDIAFNNVPTSHVDQDGVFYLSPMLWAHILCKLPLYNIYGISSTSKSIRDQVDNHVTWAHMFVKVFPQVKIKSEEGIPPDWKEVYQKNYKQLFRPLSITISVSQSQVKYGDEIEFNLKLTNYSEKVLNILLPIHKSDDFTSGRLLRTTKMSLINRHDDIVEPIPARATKPPNSFKSLVISIEKEHIVSIPARVQMYKGQLGLQMKGNIGWFLPLTEFTNQVWFNFTSDGIYANKRDPFCPESALDYWKGNVLSNSIIVGVRQVDPTLLPIRIKEYEKKCNLLLSRKLSGQIW